MVSYADLPLCYNTASTMPAVVTLTAKGDRWRRTKHPWVYRDDCESADGSLAGQIVQVKGPGGEPLGQAFYNPVSKLALRWLTQDPDQKIDREFWVERIKKALALRQRVVGTDTAYRLIHSEADGFPGLIVDRYGAVLVLQSLSLGMEQILPILADLLNEMLHPDAIVARNDSSVRTLEGLKIEKRLVYGKDPKLVEVTEGSRSYLVDVWEGHKTGAYLDQRENRRWAVSYARGRVLDGFAYQGGFSLQVGSAAEEVLAIEDSSKAFKGLEENLKRNQVTNVKAERGNLFERLRQLEKEKESFDLIILDPPAFAKNRKEVADAWRGYREINLRALRLLKSGGRLITCSCSYLVSDEMFSAILQEASRGALRPVRFLESRTQSKDHPILMTHPESKYLKCVALEVE